MIGLWEKVLLLFSSPLQGDLQQVYLEKGLLRGEKLFYKKGKKAADIWIKLMRLPYPSTHITVFFVIIYFFLYEKLCLENNPSKK